jgi:signal transduction histidine kinase
LSGDPKDVRYFIDSYFPIFGQDGNVCAVCAVVLDVTERRRLQEALLQSQQMEVVVRLAGGIAHDFNNLLTTVLGNASLALMELPPESPLRSAMHAIEDAASHGAALVQQMLAYAGERKVSAEPVDLSALVAELEPLLSTVVPKNVVVNYDLAKGLPPTGADPTQVRQVVVNLITNASEAIGDTDGAITVATGVLTYDAADSGVVLRDEVPSGSYVYIEVSDTGAGMDEATEAKMWDPFFSTKFVGRGLGLSAVRGIVRSHGGTTRVVSQPGRGTQIQVLFAATEEAP